MGSGGGCIGLGGNGGGRIDLVVGGILTVDGAMRADGGDHGGPSSLGQRRRGRSVCDCGSAILAARGR